MSAGELKSRVMLQHCSETDGWQSGEESQTWQDVAEVWARLQWMSGNEAFMAGGIFQNAVLRIKTRKLATDITRTKDYRFLVHDIAYNIVAIDDTREAGYFWFTCETAEQ